MSLDISHPQTIGGLISLCLFGSMFVTSTWRLFGATIGWNDTQHRFFLHKVIFHGAYSLYTLLETLYAVSMILYETSKWGYSLHVLALFINLGLFLMLINVWGVLLQDVNKTRNAAVVLITVNLGAIVWAIVDMHHTKHMSDFLTSHAYLAMMCANAFAKFSLCILIIVYGYQLQDTLHISPNLLDTMTKEEISIKLLLLRRIKIVLSVMIYL
jgi:hypothetical protein